MAFFIASYFIIEMLNWEVKVQHVLEAPLLISVSQYCCRKCVNLRNNAIMALLKHERFWRFYRFVEKRYVRKVWFVIMSSNINCTHFVSIKSLRK